MLNEVWRVLEPGGVFVLADSVQMADSAKFAAVMENFRRVFHEPYYRATSATTSTHAFQLRGSRESPRKPTS